MGERERGEREERERARGGNTEGGRHREGNTEGVRNTEGGGYRGGNTYQNVCGHTVACTRVHESINSLLKL